MEGYYIYICPHCLNAVGDLDYEFQYADWRQKLKKKGKFRCPACKKYFDQRDARKFKVDEWDG